MVASNKVCPVRSANYALRRELARSLSTTDLSVYGGLWTESIGVKAFHRIAVLVAAIKQGTVPNLRQIYGNLFVSYRTAKGTIDDKHELLKQSKFSLVIENSNRTITEKIFDSLINGCIPIYVGPNLEICNLPPIVAYEINGSPEEIKKLRERVAELEAEIVKLQKEIDDGTETRKKLVASEASNQAEVDKLKAKEKELGEALAKQKQLEEEKAKLEKEMNRLNLLLTDDQAQLNEQILEKSKLMDEAKKLRDEIANYEEQLKKIIEQVENATKENEKRMSERMWRIHEKVDETIQGELEESKLLGLLREKKYIDFMNFVKTKEVVKKQFTLPALFLTYESIGATWRLIEDSIDKPETFKAEKLIHDIRLFQTIENHNEHIVENYTTKYFMKFLEAFSLIAGNGEKVPPFEIETF